MSSLSTTSLSTASTLNPSQAYPKPPNFRNIVPRDPSDILWILLPILLVTFMVGVPLSCCLRSIKRNISRDSKFQWKVLYWVFMPVWVPVWVVWRLWDWKREGERGEWEMSEGGGNGIRTTIRRKRREVSHVERILGKLNGK